MKKRLFTLVSTKGKTPEQTAQEVVKNYKKFQRVQTEVKEAFRQKRRAQIRAVAAEMVANLNKRVLAGTKKILIFEDEKICRSLYEEKYSQEGINTVSYDNPTLDPVGVVLKEAPDVISMDIVMPVMDGYEATARLKADRRTRHIPIVFFTNQALKKNVERGLSLGAADYLIKTNHTPDEVIKRFKEVLGL